MYEAEEPEAEDTYYSSAGMMTDDKNDET